jgi:hypothetical protein
VQEAIGDWKSVNLELCHLIPLRHEPHPVPHQEPASRVPMSHAW